METKDHIYTVVLTWAYEKQQAGFTRVELIQSLNLEGDRMNWVVKTFFEGTNDNPPLIGHFVTRDGKDYYALSSRGIAAAIDYLELKESKESSRQAKTIAYWSIGIGVVVGLVQIIVALCK